MTAPAAPSYGLLIELDDLRERVEALAEAKLPFGLDTETGYHGDSREGLSLRAEANFIVSVQLTNSMSWARMIPLGFDSGPNVDNREAAALLWPLMHVVDDEGLPLAVPHGAVAELRWLARWFLRHLWDHPLFGRQVRDAHGYYPVRSCTLLESYAEGINQFHGMKVITALPEPAGFGHQMRELVHGSDSVLGRFLGKVPTKQEEDSVRFNVFDQADPEVIAYACEDAVYALGHHLRRWPQVRRSFIYRLEMSVLPLVCDMADVGIQYDWDLLRATAAEVRDFAGRLLAEIVGDFEELCGEKLPPDFNFNSNKQFSDLLYVKCGMPVLHRTDSGAPSVDAKNALPGLAARYPVVKKYMGWKRLHDLRLKFLDIYEDKYCWAADGRAHPSLLQHGTIAGRFACEAMNYQQSPGEYHFELRDGTRFDFNFRDAIIATRPGHRPWWDVLLQELGCPDLPEPDQVGYYILGFDYSQIELRVMAAEAGETALLEAFAAGEDVHKRTAALMLGILVEAVTKWDRKVGKTRNFASIYGQGIKALADQLGITEDDAREKDRQYQAAHPHMKPYRARVIAGAKRNGYVITKFGRRVTLHRIKDENPKVRAAEERTAGNAVIQGPATGEYVKVAMVRAVKALKAAGLERVRLIMNIHDALEFEVPLDIPPAVVMAVLQPAVVYEVKGPGVPWPEMVAEWHMGRSWGSVKDIEMLADGTVRLKPEEEDQPAVPQEVSQAVMRAYSTAPTPSSAEAAMFSGPPAPEPPPGPPREVTVLLQELPTRERTQALADFMRSLPGGNTVALKVYSEDGAEEARIPVGFKCGLTPAHEARVSMILGSSPWVRYSGVNPAELTAGLHL